GNVAPERLFTGARSRTVAPALVRGMRTSAGDTRAVTGSERSARCREGSWRPAPGGRPRCSPCRWRSWGCRRLTPARPRSAARRAGGTLVAGQVDAGLEREVHAGAPGRGIARPARVGRDDVDDAGGEGGNRRVLDRERRPEVTVLDGLAGAGRAAAIRVRKAGLVRVRAATGADR